MACETLYTPTERYIGHMTLPEISQPIRASPARPAISIVCLVCTWLAMPRSDWLAYLQLGHVTYIPLWSHIKAFRTICTASFSVNLA